MPNLIINSTFHIGQKDNQTRAFINDKDINPKTGKLGIRVYKSDGGCFQQLWVLIKSLFGRNLSIIDGSGKEIIFSKNSLKNWLEFHGKKVSSYDYKLAEIIDGIFAEQNPELKTQPLNQNKEAFSKQPKTQPIKNHVANSPEKKQKPIEKIKEAEAKEKNGSEKPEETEKAKEQALKNEKAYFINNKEKTLKNLNEIAEGFRQKANTYEAAIQKEKERIKSRLDTLKAVKISTDTVLSDLPNLSLENELNPLKLAYQWAALKYPQLEAAKVCEAEIQKINDADPETTPNLVGLLSGISKMPKQLELEDIKRLFDAEHADVHMFLKEIVEITRDLSNTIDDIIAREPIDKKIEFFRKNRGHSLKENVYDNLCDILEESGNKTPEIKNFIIETLNHGDTSDSLYEDYADRLISIWQSNGSLDEEDVKKILHEKAKEIIKKQLRLSPETKEWANKIS